MKRISVLLVLAVAFGYIVSDYVPLQYVHAQGSATLPAGASCITFGTTAGPTVVCGLPNDVQISSNGGPFVSIKGQAGPAGPAGQPGPTGAAGGNATLAGKTCTVTFTGLTQDGSGGGGATAKFSSCQ